MGDGHGVFQEGLAIPYKVSAPTEGLTGIPG